MEKLTPWKLCQQLSVVEATLLILGLDPEEQPFILSTDPDFQPKNFHPIFNALTRAVLSYELKAKIIHKIDTPSEYVHKDLTEGTGVSLKDGVVKIFFERQPDWYKTIIKVRDLKDWLQARNFMPAFFFPDQARNNNSHPILPYPEEQNYAPELYAAIKTWQATQDPSNWPEGADTAKKAILALLERDFDDLGSTAHERIAIVANFDKLGTKSKHKGDQV